MPPLWRLGGGHTVTLLQSHLSLCFKSFHKFVQVSTRTYGCGLLLMAKFGSDTIAGGLCKLCFLQSYPNFFIMSDKEHTVG